MLFVSCQETDQYKARPKMLTKYLYIKLKKIDKTKLQFEGMHTWVMRL